MIAYPTRTDEIIQLVADRAPLWQGKADARTAYYRQVNRYIKKDENLPDGRTATEFWKEVKGVFITAQYGKCAYCEMKLEVGTDAEIEWDLEHFRPKDGVNEWRYKFPTGPAMPEGYYLLAYDLENYLASCKVCNSVRKGMYFPIRNARVKHGATVPQHDPEGAYLIYPVGDFAEDPQDHVEFYGIEARPKNNSVRGQLLIDFFDLNREGLQRSRAEWLVDTFWDKLKLVLLDDQDAISRMPWMLSCEAPHTNCTQCFYRLCQTDKSKAEGLHAQMKADLKATRV